MPRLKWRSGLYAITDTKRHQKDKLLAATEAVLKGGAVVLQYRDKSNDHKRRLWETQRLKKLCDHYNAAFIINGDVELCLSIDADGVHISKNDTEKLKEIRQAIGLAKIIGLSCHTQIDSARYAMQNGANYISFGAFFKSKTKPNAGLAKLELLKNAQTLGIPVVAIGGITLNNAKTLIDAGAHNLAVISDLWNRDDHFKHAQSYRDLFENVVLPNFEQGF